jgi:ZIP family zinc transporter
MRTAGRSTRYILGVWTGIPLISGFLSMAGFLLTDFYPGGFVTFLSAVAAGGLLSMISETMIPEAFSESPDFIGFVTVLGFLLFFILIV